MCISLTSVTGCRKGKQACYLVHREHRGRSSGPTVTPGPCSFHSWSISNKSKLCFRTGETWVMWTLKVVLSPDQKKFNPVLFTLCTSECNSSMVRVTLKPQRSWASRAGNQGCWWFYTEPSQWRNSHRDQREKKKMHVPGIEQSLMAYFVKMIFKYPSV